jgi:hypothetical protein
MNTLLREGIGLNVEVTNDLDYFKESALPKINYSGNEIKEALNIEPHIILFDYGVKDYSIEVINHPSYFKIFFRTDDNDLPFDLFGASFWLLSRYEEYLPHKTDQYGRFHYRSSIAYQYDFIHVPLINLWLHELKKQLLQRWPGIQFKERNYNFVSTIDVDNVFKYKYKGFVRTLAGYISDMYRNDPRGIKERTSIIFNKTKDPFDSYDFLVKTNSEHEIRSIYFFLLGDYGINDKNHSANDLRFQALIKHLNDYAEVGIHPSYGSNNNPQQLRVEVSRLANITHRIIGKSRQHFSMLKFPQTYQALLQAGLNEDYSMGYTNLNGFRASYCYPFKWYSLEDEQESNLLIHPFCMTEISVETGAKKNNKRFIEQADPIISEVKKYRGQFICIFHNDTFTEEMKKNYLDLVNKAKV